MLREFCFVFGSLAYASFLVLSIYFVAWLLTGADFHRYERWIIVAICLAWMFAYGVMIFLRSSKTNDVDVY
jgi:hypothetical protein